MNQRIWSCHLRQDRPILRGIVRSLRSSVLVVALLVSSATPLWAGVPIYHGQLAVGAARTTIDDASGNVVMTVRNFLFRPDLGSNGMFPAEEQVTIGLGIDSLLLPAGSLVPNKKGTKFTYRSPGGRDRDITFFRMSLTPAGDWKVKFKVVGMSLSQLTIVSPSCESLAVIVGDDDAFSGVTLARKTNLFGEFIGKRVKLQGACEPEDWPWD